MLQPEGYFFHFKKRHENKSMSFKKNSTMLNT